MQKTNKTLNLTTLLLISALALTLTYPVQAQTQSTPFTPAEKFSSPQQNSTINFGFKGSYSEATLENGTWIFKDLQLEHPQSFGFFDLNGSQSIGTLKFAAENCNVTIWAYLTFYYTLPVHSLVYSVEGSGRQIVNLGLNFSEPSHPSEWSVIVPDNVFLAEGQGWKLLPDDSLLVTVVSSNVTIAHFKLGSFEKSAVFYLQHSVAIITGIVFAVVVAAALVIRARTKKIENAEA